MKEAIGGNTDRTDTATPQVAGHTGATGWADPRWPRDLADVGRLPLAAGTLLAIALYRQVAERRIEEHGDGEEAA